jgi:hypothetical protein
VAESSSADVGSTLSGREMSDDVVVWLLSLGRP